MVSYSSPHSMLITDCKLRFMHVKLNEMHMLNHLIPNGISNTSLCISSTL